MLARARRAQRPLVVGEHAQAARGFTVVRERQSRQPHRLARVHEHGQLAVDVALPVLVARDPGAVPGHPAAALARARQRPRGRAPAFAGVLVAQVERLAAELAHGIVAEGREPVLAAVARPRPRRAGGAQHRAEALVGDHVDPRQRGVGIAVQHDDVLATVRAEAAEAVRVRQSRVLHVAPGFVRERSTLARARGQWFRPFGFGTRQAQVGCEVAGLAAQHRARGREQDRALGVGRAGAAQQVDAAGAVLPCGPRALLQEALQLLVHLVAVGLGMVVQDHDVGPEPLQPPVLLSAQDLERQRHVLSANRAHYENRKVARYAERPQPRLAQRVAGEHLGGRSQLAVGPQHAGSEALVEPCLGHQSIVCITGVRRNSVNTLIRPDHFQIHRAVSLRIGWVVVEVGLECLGREVGFTRLLQKGGKLRRCLGGQE